MAIVSADMEQYPALMEAIGRVVANSAWMSQLMQQAVVRMAGTREVYFELEDKTLGAQFKHSREVVLAVPEERSQHRAELVGLLMDAELLVPYRNRVAHDHWLVFPRDGLPDGVTGRRATGLGRSLVLSNIASMERLAAMFLHAAGAFAEVDRAVNWKENHARGRSRTLLEIDLRVLRGDSVDESWIWETRPWVYRPRKGEADHLPYRMREERRG